ncbi:MAG: hypothetical protein GY862_29120 [Gammaproteobacteria bacterium]|nr:hypothetical protein [Gammaproteobacteria bacterium]
MTSSEQAEKKLHKDIAAGRAFKQAFDELNNADKSILRRGDRDPATLRAFWDCMNTAQLRKRVDFYVKLLPLLDLLQGCEDGKNLGAFLRRHTRDIALRRVEALFAATDLTETLENLESVAAIVKGKGASLDFGVLVHDLIRFQYDPNQVRRNWAQECFATPETSESQAQA